MSRDNIHTLIVRKKPEDKCIFAISIDDGMVFEIGRGSKPQNQGDAYLQITEDFFNSDTVSRHHARICRKGPVYWIEHLSRTNLTRVNEKVVLSFREFKLPSTVKLGEVTLFLSEEEIDKNAFPAFSNPAGVLKSPQTALETKTVVGSLRRDWPVIHEEIRWASTLDQIQQVIKSSHNPDAAAGSVSELLSVYLSAREVVLFFNLAHHEMTQILKNYGNEKEIEENRRDIDDMKFNSIVESNSYSFSNISIYVQPSVWETDHTISMCVADFKKAVPASAVSEKASALVGISLANLEMAINTSRTIETSRRESRENFSVKISRKMQKLREEIGYWGESPSFLKMLHEADVVSQRCLIENNEDKDLPNVLFIGEPGVGKTDLARLIQQLSDHAGGPFIEVNCANIIPTLAESILFGTVKGFIPEVKDNIGLFEMAHNGVLFLDEVGNLPMEVQAKILSTINSGVFNRLGDRESRKTNCYVILATNADLEDCIEKGLFRHDLYDRINTWEIRIPSLKERKDDISLIIDKTLERLNKDKKLTERLGTPVPKHLEPSLRDTLKHYQWPGNVRELIRNLEAGFKKTNHAEIAIKDMPRKLQKSLGKRNTVYISEGVSVDTESSLYENILRLEIAYFCLLMRKNNGVIQAVQKQAEVSPTTFSKRRQKEYPALIKRLPENEVEQLKEIAGPFWHKLIIEP